METTRSSIANTDEKIERLRQALHEISSTHSDMESVKRSINSLNIDQSSWRGEKENEFDDHYNHYEDSVKSYISKVEDAQETIRDDINRYETEKASYTSSLNHLESSLHSLNWQIRVEQRE